MTRILIIGIGNPLRCDDGLAWRVIHEMSHQGLPEDVEIITRHQLTPELAEPASQAETVLFLDAAQDGQAGELRCAPVGEANGSSLFSHEFSPASILGLARELYGGSPRGFLISLSGECFDHGETLSSQVERKLPQAVSFLRDLLAETTPGSLMRPTHG